MTNRDTIDAIFRALAIAPKEIDCTNHQVLSACGLLVAAIMRECFADPIGEAQSFCGALMACVDPALRAKLAQSRQPTLN